MTKPLDKVRAAVRLIVDEKTVDGSSSTTGDIFDELKDRYPDVLEAQAEMYLRRAVQAEARSLLKKPVSEAEEDTVPIPRELVQMKAPRQLPLPMETAEGREWEWRSVANRSINQINQSANERIRKGQEVRLSGQKLRHIANSVAAHAEAEEFDTPLTELIPRIRERWRREDVG